jgi:hypothetical protein
MDALESQDRADRSDLCASLGNRSVLRDGA